MINIILLLIILFILFSTKIERFVDDLFYPDGVELDKNVNLNEPVTIEGNIKVSQVCPRNDDELCANSKNLSFIKTDMPALKPMKVCIGEQCIEGEHLDFLKNNYEIRKTDNLKFKVVSSGLVSGKRGGKSEFYINDKQITNLPIGRGFNVLVITPQGNKYEFKNFDTHASYDNSKKMIEFVNNIPMDYYVLVSVYDEATNKDRPFVNIYEHSRSRGWKRSYKLNSNGDETKVVSTWKSPNGFPDNSVSSYDVSEGITAIFNQHDFDDRNQGVITAVGPKYNQGVGWMNDHISTILIKKTNVNNSVSPYEALMNKCGGNGVVVPNYRGSYIFIGKRGLPSGQAGEWIKNSGNNYRNDVLLTKEKTFATNLTFVDILKRS